MKRKESLILLFSFRLARRNVITKRNENWAWSQVTKIECDLRLLNYWAWSQVRVACEAQMHFRSSLLSRKCVCASQAKVRGFLCQANRKPRSTSKYILIGSNPLTQTSGMVWKPFCTFCTSYQDHTGDKMASSSADDWRSMALRQKVLSQMYVLVISRTQIAS